MLILNYKHVRTAGFRVKGRNWWQLPSRYGRVIGLRYTWKWGNLRG